MKSTTITILLAALLAAGCSSKPPAPSGPPSPAAYAASVASTKQQISKVQNDTSIPDSTKQIILGRLQGNLDRTEQASKQAGSSTPQAQ